MKELVDMKNIIKKNSTEKLKNKAEELQKVEKGEREEKAGKNNKYRTSSFIYYLSKKKFRKRQKKKGDRK